MTPDTFTPTRRPLSITLAGVLATLVLLALVLTFLRLGFWQVARLQERRAVNRAIAARLEAPPIADTSLLTDTAGLFYRSVAVEGAFDDAHSIVFPGRSHRGVPGVYLITPLLLAGRTDGVLVNRGWVPSPDAATIDFGDFRRPGMSAIRGMVVPFPGPGESLAPVQPAGDSGFRRVWYAVDESALRAQFPYPLLPVMLQELPEGDEVARRGTYPAQLDPPALGEGPHLGYALQWFSFALIGVIGWIALVRRGRTPQRVVPPAPVLVLLLLATPGPAAAQLRPLDPFDWRVFEGATQLVAAAGAGALWDQPAPLAGSVGRLVEAGNYAVSLRSGRIAVELSGTAVWRLREESQREPAAPWVSGDPGIRQDAGPAHVTTAVLVSGAAWPADLVLRFGARLPTTGFPSGLERDRTDFHALAGARYVRGALELSMEHGLGVHGAVFGRYPQSDMWLYSATVAVSHSALRVSSSIVGQQDGHRGRIRGNEDQRELRIGVDAGDTRWISAQYIHGLSRYSPAHGLRIGVGFTIGRSVAPSR